MYSILIAVVLVASVSAKAQIPVNLAGYGEIREDKPQPCCAPSAYTGNAGKLLQTKHLPGSFLVD